MIIATLIVKNEEPVIARCIASLMGKVDGFCICDTGSTDRTLPVANEAVGDMPMLLWQHPWPDDYAQARNLNLEAAQAAFPKVTRFLHIDADEMLHGLIDANAISANPNGCRIAVHLPDGKTFPRTFLSGPNLRFTGKLHEVLYVPDSEILRGCYIESRADGARARDPQTHVKDLRILEDMCFEAPNDPRLTLQLAMAYEQVADYKSAAFFYQQVCNDHSSSPYGRCAAYRVAVMEHLQGMRHEDSLLRAADLGHPAAVLALANIWNGMGLPSLALQILDNLWPNPEDLMAPPWWQIEDEISVAAAGCGKLSVARQRCMQALTHRNIPAAERARIVKNFEQLPQGGE